MLRRCLPRAQRTHNVLTLRGSGLHACRASTKGPTPRVESETVRSKPVAPPETPRQKLVRYLFKPSAAPPLTAHLKARYPLVGQLIYGVTVGFACLLTLHLVFEYAFVLEGAYGISMLPTIASMDDWLLISKYYRRGRDVEVGDLVSYKHPVRQGEFAVKRVVGLSGDFVLTETAGRSGRMLQVPEGHCWVVGDNLTWSRDSRMFGPLPLALITGKVIAKCSWNHPWPQKLENGLKPAVVEAEVD